MIAFDRDDLLGLVRTLAEALSDAKVELEAIAETPMPLSAGVDAKLNEHVALKETLSWVRQQHAGTAFEVDLLERYREAAAAALHEEEEGRFPVGEEPVEHIRRAEEELVRATILDGDVRSAMRGAHLRADLAGC